VLLLHESCASFPVNKLTMANPFALVSVGCCYLFLFLSLHTASCPPCLHLDQTALSTARWFALGDGFALANRSSSSTMMDDLGFAITINKNRGQWDPGMPTSSTRLRRQWDPVIPMVLSLIASVCQRVIPMVLFSSPWRQWDPGMRRQWDPGMLKHSKTQFVLMSPPVPLHASIGSTCRCPFQHCHPVLSRPAVPNVI